MLRIAFLLWLTTFTILLFLISVISLAQPLFNIWMPGDLCGADPAVFHHFCPASACSSFPPSIPLSFAPVLGQPPRPYYRKLVESIVGDLRFPNTLTISCMMLCDSHYSRLSTQNSHCSPEIIFIRWQKAINKTQLLYVCKKRPCGCGDVGSGGVSQPIRNPL